MCVLVTPLNINCNIPGCLFEIQHTMSSGNGSPPSIYIKTSSEDGDLTSDPSLHHILQTVKMQIPLSLDAVRVYQVEADIDDESRQEYLHSLCEDLAVDLYATVQRTMLKLKEMPLTYLQEEVITHARYCLERAPEWNRSPVLLNRIKVYFWESFQSGHPLVLFGSRGSGKSCMIAKIIMKLDSWLQMPCAKVVRFGQLYHKLSSMKDILISLCGQICAIYNIKVVDESLKGHIGQMAKTFHRLLDHVSKEHSPSCPLVILINGIEHLYPCDTAVDLSWIPKLCPSGVYIVIGCSLSSERVVSALKNRLDKNIFLDVSPSVDESEKHLQSVLVHPIVPLTAKQKQTLLKAQTPLENNANSLFIKLYSRQIMDSGDNVPSVKEMIVGLFNQWEDDFGALVTASTLAFLTLSHTGLMEHELKCLLRKSIALQTCTTSQHDNNLSFLWAKLWHEMQEYLMPQHVYGMLVLRWRYEIFSECVQEIYLTSATKKGVILYKECLKDMINMYNNEIQNCKDVRAKPSTRILNILPYYVYISTYNDPDKRSKQLIGMYLSNFEWLQFKLSHTSVGDILGDFYMMKHHNKQINILRAFFEMRKKSLQEQPSDFARYIISCLKVPKGSKSLNYLVQLVKSAYAFLSNQGKTELIPSNPFMMCPTGLLKREYSGPMSILGLFSQCGQTANKAVLWGRDSGLEVWNMLSHSSIDHISDNVTSPSQVFVHDSSIIFYIEDTYLMSFDANSREHLMSMRAMPETERKQKSDGFLTLLGVSQDAKTIVVTVNIPELMKDPTGLLIIDTDKQEVVYKLLKGIYGQRISNLCFVDNGTKVLFTVTQTNQTKRSAYYCFDLNLGEMVIHEEIDAHFAIKPKSASIAPDEAHAVFICLPNDILVLSVPAFTVVYEPTVPQVSNTTKVKCAEFFSNDSLLILCNISSVTDVHSVLKRWNFQDNKSVIMFECKGERDLLTIADDKVLCAIVCKEKGMLDIFSLTSSHHLATLTIGCGKIQTIHNCLFGPDRDLYVGFLAAIVKRFDLSDFAPKRTKSGSRLVSAGSIIGSAGKSKQEPMEGDPSSSLQIIPKYGPTGETSKSFEHLKNAIQILEIKHSGHLVVAYGTKQPAIMDPKTGVIIKHMETVCDSG